MRTPEQEMRDYYQSFAAWMLHFHRGQFQMMQIMGTSREKIEPFMREWAQDITSTKGTK
jgi:uncharacterized protein (DUF305 family)